MPRASSMIELKNSKTPIINSKAMRDRIDAERMTKQLNELIKSRRGKRAYHR